MKVKSQDNIINIIDDNHTIYVINCNFSDSINILVEKDGTIIYSCEKFNKLFKENPLNKKLSDIVAQPCYEEIRKMMLEGLFTNKQVFSQIVFLDKIYKIVIFPILDNDIIKYLFISACDISNSKKIDDEIEDLKNSLAESNSIKSIFLSNISHELRSPMNVIIGLSDILLQNQKIETQTIQFLKSINSNAKHLDELLNNILEYSKIESRDFDILYENFSINELFEELSDLFQDTNYKKNLGFVKLEFLIVEDKKIICDYLRLKQVLFNILSNSIKFTDNGHIKVEFNVDDNFIIFKVEDTGIGISEDRFKFVFDRFWQNDSSSSKKYKGTGLGLSVSKSIIELLNGEIWLDSKLGQGTTFYIKIPLEEIK